jgi:hypothetical protein
LTYISGRGQYSAATYDAGIWTVQKIDHKYVESFEVLCWRKTLNTSSTEHVKDKEVEHRIKDEINILHAVTKGKRTGLVTYKLLAYTRY